MPIVTSSPTSPTVRAADPEHLDRSYRNFSSRTMQRHKPRMTPCGSGTPGPGGCSETRCEVGRAHPSLVTSEDSDGAPQRTHPSGMPGSLPPVNPGDPIRCPRPPIPDVRGSGLQAIPAAR